MALIEAGPSDVLAVWTDGGFASDLIRAGEALEGKPAVANHVVIITHQDALGRWIGIQGQPGGVGLCDCTPYLSDSRTRSNHTQPRGMYNLPFFLASCAKSIGVRYDWVGIAEDALGALHAADISGEIDKLWRWPSDHGQLPGEVVCSSLAAILYKTAGWAHPDLGTERVCEPADWWNWSDRRLWVPIGP
jgi:hypothetical protein